MFLRFFLKSGGFILKKDWTREDSLFAPKKKMSNLGSHQKPHIIGSFYSYRNNTTVEYQSLNEFIFFSLLEIDRSITRYYPQPVEVPIFALSRKGICHKWNHIPDVLVFRKKDSPILFQIKESPNSLTKTNHLNNRKAKRYANNRNWEYKMVFPKELSPIVINNIKLLSSFKRSRYYFEELKPKVKRTLARHKKMEIEDLIRYLTRYCSRSQALPLIYYLIAYGDIMVDLSEPINMNTVLLYPSDSKTSLLEEYFMKDGDSYAIEPA